MSRQSTLRGKGKGDGRVGIGPSLTPAAGTVTAGGLRQGQDGGHEDDDFGPHEPLPMEHYLD